MLARLIAMWRRALEDSNSSARRLRALLSPLLPSRNLGVNVNWHETSGGIATDDEKHNK